MMLWCHRLNLMRMSHHQVDIPPVEPSLADEGASQNSHNLLGCVKEEMIQSFLMKSCLQINLEHELNGTRLECRLQDHRLA